MLTAVQLEAFCQNGYLRLPDILPAALLNRLRDLFDYLMYSESGSDEKVIIETKGKKFITNLEHICAKGNLACLELLGFPPVLETARAVCGDDFFLIQEFAVIKNLGDELPVLWHQDMVHQRSGQCFTMGIYLDNADEGDGALRIVPGSHLKRDTICGLSREPFIEVPMQAGDILIHDMMLAHCSEPLRKNPVRRVVYFEFLSAAHVSRENIYSNELVMRRSRLHHAAAEYYRQLHPEDHPLYQPGPAPYPDDIGKNINEILKEIYALPVNAKPSAYCLENKSIFSDV